MKKNILIATVIAFAFGMTSCASKKQVVQQPQVRTFNLALVSQPQAEKYANLEYGIRLNVQDVRANKRVIHVYDASATSIPTAQTNPAIASFVPESVRRYMRTMGFNLDADVATDYLMQLDIKEFHVDYLSGIGWSGTVIMDLKVQDHNRTFVYPTVEVSGRANVSGSSTSDQAANLALNKAYANALADVDWDRIAYFLHRAKDPKQEANKKVAGEGNTALEHLTVHWNVNSRPQGADVFWRVISQTPEVKNQNYKYLETTPYEGSETINIKGLTYNNAGNVQIEIKVEKKGYYTQTKKLDILSLIDDNDVSYMFKLVSEEE
ncbi:MAG: hypothetical protein IJP76_09625 [Paludibacteraceae bacterium]|nr:hypothetical protein [Paludibacteraceae bacterium]MBQ9602644.1 hypothetical protein [Paludibacteraceae bacterium]